MFSQILRLIPQVEFAAALHLLRAVYVRSPQGLRVSEGKLRHLGLPEAPSRSTLAHANEHRPWQLTETVSSLTR